MAYSNSTTLANNFQLDAFARLRVSNPYTIFTSTNVYNQSNLFDYINNNGSITYRQNESLVELATDGTEGSRVVLQSSRYIQYQPGKSLLIMMTGLLHSSSNTDIRCRMGYFDSNVDKTVDSGGNGVYLEYENGNYYFVLRSYNSGNESNNRVARADWNKDNIDSLLLNKSIILFFDIEWLGVGNVRCGFVINGESIIAHEFNNSNILTSTYMTTANLPIRYEIEQINDGDSGMMKAICCSAISEGGYNPRGFIYSSTGSNQLLLQDSDEHLYIAFRNKSAYNRVIVNPLALDFVCDTDAIIILKYYLGAYNCITGTFTTNETNIYSSVEYIYWNTSNYNIESFSNTNYFRAIGQKQFRNSLATSFTLFENIYFPSSDIQGRQRWLIVTVKKISGNNTNIIGNAQWQEWR